MIGHVKNEHGQNFQTYCEQILIHSGNISWRVFLRECTAANKAMAFAADGGLFHIPASNGNNDATITRLLCVSTSFQLIFAGLFHVPVKLC